MRNVKIMSVLAVVLVAGLAEAGRELHLHPIFEASSREELADIAGYGEEKLSTVLITGSVVCRDHEASSPPRHVSGLKVRVECTSVSENAKTSSFEETITDEYGVFTLDLPSQLHATQNLDEACKVKVLQVPTQGHNKGSFITMKHNGIIKLVSAHNGVRTYTTGKIHLHRLKLKARESIASAVIRLAKLPVNKWQG